MDGWNGRDWRTARLIALVVSVTARSTTSSGGFSRPVAIPFVSRTTARPDDQPGRRGRRSPRRARRTRPDLEAAADRLRAAGPVAAAYVDTSISFVAARRRPRDRGSHPALPARAHDRHLDGGRRGLPRTRRGTRRRRIGSIRRRSTRGSRRFFGPQGAEMSWIGKPRRAWSMATSARRLRTWSSSSWSLQA